MSVTFNAAAPVAYDFGICYAPVEGGPELNMSNANAVHLLALLGFTHDEDYHGGVVDAQDFLGRILLAEAMLDVATDDEHGRPSVEHKGGGMTLIECGTEPGYLADRLAILHEVATWAQHRHLKVAWA